MSMDDSSSSLSISSTETGISSRSMRDSSGNAGCTHYKRNCEIICPTCAVRTPCRLCHDSNVPDHELERFNIAEVVCAICDTKQPVSNKCVHCPDTTFGEYYCGICHLWDSSNKEIWHCEKCGICRKGGQSKFFHCDKCHGCFANTTKDTHKCIENAFADNCAICTFKIFDATEGPVVLGCGHCLHAKCYNDYINYVNSRRRPRVCPLCQKNI